MTNTLKGHILGIESSCDDTGVAIINQDGRILSNCIHSQLRETILLGGVIPVVAKELHLSNIDKVARRAFEESGLKSVPNDITAIAVTNRPGMDFSLKVGLNYAKALAKKYSKPLIPIHHMQAHALMPLLQNRSIRFPFLALLISGGHCLLAITKNPNEYHLLGQSTDDAPGDLLDKVARRLKLKNLGPPFSNISGGAAIELLAEREGSNRFKYFNTETSIPVLRLQNCDFSFSGYRGTFEKLIPKVDNLWSQGNREKLLDELGDICASLQRGILIQLVKRLQRAILYYKMYWKYQNEDAFSKSYDQLGFTSRALDELDDSTVIDIVVSGGVAANKYILEGIKLASSEVLETESRVYAPSKSLCSDNGLMIAWNGLLRYREYCQDSGSKGERHDLEYGVNNPIASHVDEIDSIQTLAQCPIGLDIRSHVRAAKFSLAKFEQREFKLSDR